jgi:hypothetical protein
MPLPKHGPRRDWLEAQGKYTRMDESKYLVHLSHLANKRPNEITAYNLDPLMSDLRATGRSPQTIRHVIGLIRRIMRRMIKRTCQNIQS